MIPNINFNKKIKNSTRFLNENVLYLLFGISIALKSLLFQVDSEIGNVIGNIGIVLSSIAMLLIIFSILYLIKPKLKMLIVFLIYLFLSILLLADTVYFRYYSNVISISLLKLSAFAGDVKESIFSLFELKDILYIIDIPVLFLLMILTIKNGKRDLKLLKRLKRSFFIIVLGFLLLAIPYRFSYQSLYKYDQGRPIKDLGVLYYHYLDIKKFLTEDIFKNNNLTKSEEQVISNYYKNKAEEDKSTVKKRYTGIAKGKNLIVIQVEALQQFAINRKYNGQEVTPFLNKLISSNIYFNNFYYQARAGNTADAEFLTNTSLYSLQNIGGIPYVNYASGKYYSLAKTLKAKGYSAYAFHGYKPSYWNRAIMYQSLGFDKFISMNDFSQNKKFGLGIGDIDMFKESLDKIQSMNKKNKPFFGFFVTLSSHYSFANFTNNYPFDIKGLEGTTVGKFLRAANYEDKAIESFITDLKKRGLYSNSLIVIYGDHNAVSKMQFDEMKRLLNKNDISPLEWAELQKVPCVIAGGPIKKGELITAAGGQIDTMPTIANLMDFKVPYALGKDLLNTKNGYAYSVARDGSFATDKYFYLGSESKAYDINTNSVLKPNVYKDMLKNDQNVSSMSDTIISKNAFKTFTLK